MEETGSCSTPKAEEKPSKARGGGCCPGEAGKCSSASDSKTAAKETGCCISEPVAPINDGGDGCCGSLKTATKCSRTSGSKTEDLDQCPDPCCKGEDAKDAASSATPVCCEGKPSPCCNDDCIDRIALRECEKTPSDSTGCSTEHAAGGIAGCESSETPCAYHVRQARNKFEERLAAIGCICRALIAMGQKSCCVSPQDASSPKAKNRTKKRAAPKAPGTPCGATSEAPSKSCSGDACCSGKRAGPSKKPALQESAKDLHINTDVERGLAGVEHAVVSVTGMTCTGCETKLVRTLGSFQGVKNLKTSLIMSRAEFDYDPRAISAADLIRQLEKKTGFVCEEISTKGASIDVLPTGDVPEFAQQALPLGVTAMAATDNSTVRISFDPKVVGARDLMERAFGAHLELAPTRQDSGLDAGSKHVRHMGYMTVFSAALTIPVLVLAWAPLSDRPVTYGAASLALATIVQVAVAGPFYPAALKSLLFSRMIEMDLLIVLSTSAAYIFSVVSFGYLAAGSPLATGQFFETSTLLVTLIMVGRFVSAFARNEALKSISIRALQESKATLVSVDDSVPDRDVDSRLLQYGDVFKLKADCRAPTDGIVLSGSSEVDESMLTGESRPVEKHTGSLIAAGSVNGPGNLVVRLTRLPDENTVSTIADMVDDAKLTKPQLQSMADYVASRFVPLVVGLTVLVFVVWIGVGIREQKRTPAESAIQAITYAITVLIVSCPCAIGLAVPMVIVIASGMAARRGIIFKSASGIETVHKATHIVFDKTGTLTEGILSVTAEQYFGENSPTSAAAAILGLVDGIKHPVSVAMASHLKNQVSEPIPIRDIKSLTGKGVEGFMGESRIQAGNPRWLGLESNDSVRETSARGLTTLCVTIDSQLIAVFGLSDSVRAEAVSVVMELKKRGIALSVLSGDELQAVARIAQSVGIPESMVKARCSPADKAKYIKDLTSASPDTSSTISGGIRSKKSGSGSPANNVIFVGDGTNDAPALAQANTGVHLPPSASTAAADVASSAADVVLLRSSLDGLIDMLDISRAAVRRIWFNFGWSFVYNVFAILLAAGAFVASAHEGGSPGVRIPPEYAGLGELVSVLPVVLVAVSLRWARVWGQWS
ncbi:copper-transporting ATPase 2 [Apiospora marii]|uniref:Copper-transporting ATPase 2 n=1 Tax=Apiospora marii TaxID=335849 RepID=A0ABR1SFP0_9PEZI